MMNPLESTNGFAPAIARSLTVPLTASSPMSPPGKKSGLHEGVGGEGKARAVGAVRRQEGAVAERLQQRVAQLAQDQRIDQVVARLAARPCESVI